MSRSCIHYFRDESLGKVSTLIANERGEGRVLTRREMRASLRIQLGDGACLKIGKTRSIVDSGE